MRNLYRKICPLCGAKRTDMYGHYKRKHGFPLFVGEKK